MKGARHQGRWGRQWDSHDPTVILSVVDTFLYPRNKLSKHIVSIGSVSTRRKGATVNSENFRLTKRGSCNCSS